MLLASAGLGALWLPGGSVTPPTPKRTDFGWDAGAYLEALERRFVEQREASCPQGETPSALQRLDAQLVVLEAAPEAAPTADTWKDLEEAVFDAAVISAACPEHATAFSATVPRIQEGVRKHSSSWDLVRPDVLARLYRLRYGLRAAFEEVLEQVRERDLMLTRGVDDRFALPQVTLHGVVIQSGDILVSRGGAPTSALIARGNDRPGNFSHVALVHVSSEGEASVIESHIESGVGVFSAQQYLADKKLRIMVLRLTPDHPALKRTPDLPAQAAAHALDKARNNPPGYDFAMDFKDPVLMFCSEVVYDAYRSQGVHLWKALSSLSGPASGRWLASLGVEHFETLAPSDLEYDPQLRVVAEWRNPKTLSDDRIDNAIIDALLDRAERGLDLRYEPAKLGLARAAKVYSVILNRVGLQGPVPEGMSASSALRVERLRELHAELDKRVRVDRKRFEQEHGYAPPYWQLVRMAQKHANAIAVD